jgi:penicillin-insensitive murein endopeptidase
VRRRLVLVLGAAALAVGCTRTPSPLNPAIHGSIGTTSTGFLTEGVPIANAGETRWLRDNERHYGIPRFVRAVERAARAVTSERPGSVLVTGDISARRGGRISHHLSHASGRDADLLLYLQTLEGVPVALSPGFLSFDADGLAWDRFHGRFVRFDVAREWLLVKTLLEDDEARVQWIFISEVLKAIVVEWARANGDSAETAETIRRAQDVMHQPHPGEPHDDHIHVRTGCTAEDVADGCQQTGPERDWWKDPAAPLPDSDADLVMAIAVPIEAVPASAQR